MSIQFKCARRVRNQISEIKYSAGFIVPGVTCWSIPYICPPDLYRSISRVCPAADLYWSGSGDWLDESIHVFSKLLEWWWFENLCRRWPQFWSTFWISILHTLWRYHYQRSWKMQRWFQSCGIELRQLPADASWSKYQSKREVWARSEPLFNSYVRWFNTCV